MIDVKDFKTIIAGLQCAYPRHEVVTTDQAFRLWYSSLRDIDKDALTRAAEQHILQSPFPPSISELRQRAYNLTAPPDELASVEWDKLMRYLSHAYSPDGREKWESLTSLTREIVGGFHTFQAWSCTSTEQLEMVQRPMFIKRFEARISNARQQASAPVSLRNPSRTIKSSPLLQIEEVHDEPHEKIEAPPELLNRLRRRLGGTG